MLTIFLISIFFIGGCAKQNLQEENDGKISIVTTLYPLYEFSKEVGGEKTNVILLLPPGAEAHTFEPKPSDIIKINNADIFVYVGASFEPWAHDIIEGSNNKKIILFDASSKVTLLKSDEHGENSHEHEGEHVHEDGDHDAENETNLEDEHSHGEYDPHFWLDFNNDMKVVDAITETLSEKDPTNKEYYFLNAENYKKRLLELDAEYKEGLKSCKQKEFITGGHNAYAYLAKSQGIEYLSAFGISPDSEPTPKAIKEIADITKEHGIKYILFEELVSPRMAEAIAEQAGAKILVLNPGHNLLKEEFNNGVTFISLMENNLKTLKIALECD
jgi:zinc transport system substrate-binding protein